MSDYNKIDVIAMQNAQYSGTPQANNIRAKAVTLFAEHRSASSVLGYFGGDAYPASWSMQMDDRQVGVLIAADGVGNGSFIHQRLIDTLESEVGGTERDKLHYFLRQLYGPEFFEDAEALDYAVRSFSPIPPNCFFNTDMPEGTPPGGQINVPFYKKDSQYLSSRIIAVAVFYKFRNYFADKEVTPDTVARLRHDLEFYIDGESDIDGNYITKGDLRKAIEGLFLYEEGKVDKYNRPLSRWMDAKRKDRYFLPCTLACWFFVEPKGADHIDAVACYVGDARAYKVDLADGVMQISVDDAEPTTNTMDCCIRYRSDADHCGGTGTSAHDCAIKATYTQVKKPCALFACSDGVYDTCMPNPTGTHKVDMKIGGCPDYEAYEHPYDCSDIAFEYNYLQLLRRANSLDDIVQYTARSIYVHTDPTKVGDNGAIAVVSRGSNPINVKRDDSSTMAMMFFDNGDSAYPQLLDAIKDATTSLDKAVQELQANQGGPKYCTSYPNEGVSQEAVNEALMQYSNEFCKNQSLRDLVSDWAQLDIDAAIAAEADYIWGSAGEGGLRRPGSAADAPNFVNSNIDPIFNKLLADGQAWLLRNNPADDKNSAIEGQYQELRKKLAIIVQFAAAKLAADGGYVRMEESPGAAFLDLVNISLFINDYINKLPQDDPIRVRWKPAFKDLSHWFYKRQCKKVTKEARFTVAFNSPTFTEETKATFEGICQCAANIPDCLVEVSLDAAADAWSRHIVFSAARYRDINAWVKQTFTEADSGVGIGNLDSYIAIQKKKRMDAIGERFAAVKQAYDAYDALVSAKREVYKDKAPDASDYTVIYKALNRGAAQE